MVSPAKAVASVVGESVLGDGSVSLERLVPVPVGERWAHARGKFLLTKLGVDKSSLAVTPNFSPSQYTTPGYVFTIHRLDTELVAFPIDDVIQVYLVPLSAANLTVM